MATLEIHMRTATAPGYDPATAIELVGSVDPSTLNLLEDVMDRSVAEGKSRIIFDLAGLKYINSTGMGMFVMFADSLREAGGNLVLMRIQPKVLLVIEMLGLQELFRIVPDEASALPALSGAETGDVAVVDLSEEELAALETSDDDENDARPEPAEPTHMACPTCRARIVSASVGNYRCPRCRAVLQLDGNGLVRSYPEDVRHAVEMSLPPESDFLAAAQPLLHAQCKAARLPEDAAGRFLRTALVALTKLATMLRRHTAGDMRLHLFARGAEGKMVLRVYCAGDALAADSFNNDQGGVTRLKYEVSALGNLLTIEQSIAAPAS